MVTMDNEKLFGIADDMCRRVSGMGNYGTGYGHLIGFERIVEKVMNKGG